MVWFRQHRHSVMEDQEIVKGQIEILCRPTNSTGGSLTTETYKMRPAGHQTHPGIFEPPGRFPLLVVRQAPGQCRRRRCFHIQILTSSSSPVTARTLAACPPHQNAYLTDLFDATRPNHLKRLHENRHWQHWATFAVSIGQHPLLPNAQTQANHLECTMLFLAFAVALRQGRFHNGNLVR
jgi:hypothetical protein